MRAVRPRHARRPPMAISPRASRPFRRLTVRVGPGSLALCRCAPGRVRSLTSCRFRSLALRSFVRSFVGSPGSTSSSVVARSASWDPENLYKNSPEMTGLIDRKLMGNRAQEDKTQKTVMQKFMDAAKAETQAKRDAREVPEDKYELIAFLLDTEATDMQFEVARCRPLLDDEFFEVLNKQIGGCW
jgi:hypothetical protein